MIVTFELLESTIVVMLCRLVDGAFARSPGDITPTSELHCFDLNDLVSLRGPTDVLPALEPGVPVTAGGPEGIARKQARNMHLCARDVLDGDFHIFPELDRIVKERARLFEQ